MKILYTIFDKKEDKVKKGKEKGKESSSKNVPSCQSDEKIRRKNKETNKE